MKAPDGYSWVQWQRRDASRGLKDSMCHLLKDGDDISCLCHKLVAGTRKEPDFAHFCMMCLRRAGLIPGRPLGR
jgi:hypothetical protein